MKNKKSIQPSKCWYVTSIDKLESIKESGIYSHGRRLKLIHKLQFGLFPFEESKKYLTADYLAIWELENRNNLQYAVLEISTVGMEKKLKRCHTEGVVLSNCTYSMNIYHIKHQQINSFEIRTIDLDSIQCLNELRLRNAMHSEPIQNKNSNEELSPKEKAYNNRICSEKQSAIRFNTTLLNLRYGNYEPIHSRSSNTDIDELVNVA